MGNCDAKSPQVPINNPDDPINQEISIKDACAPAGSASGSMRHLIPKNGEYEWAGEGASCNYCSLDAPKSVTCSSGCDGVNCCSIIGVQGKYKRVSYKADPIDCCLNQTKTVGGKTCNPIYRNPKSDSCYNVIKNHCTQGDNIFKDTKVCQSWCSENLVECDIVKSLHCNKPGNTNKPECQKWCMQHQGKCDSSFVNFCNDPKNIKNPKCSCINSSLVHYKYNPLCSDRECIDHGYSTSSMQQSRGDGCSIVDCSTYFDVKSNGNVKFTDLDLEQKCGNVSSEDNTIINSGGIDNKYIIISGVVAVILIIIVGVSLIFYFK